MATSESDKLKLKRFQKNMFRVGKVVNIAERIDRAEHFEAIRTARALANRRSPKTAVPNSRPLSNAPGWSQSVASE